MEMSITLRKLKEHFADSIFDLGNAFGDDFAVVRKEKIPEVAQMLRDDSELRYNFLIDITAVDHLRRTPRFEVVYQFFSLPLRHRVRLNAPVDFPDPELPSLVSLWKGANWLEREVWDMFGIRFAGHPDLRRILLYPEFEGHPLRKDYPVNRRHPLVGPKN
jgi:NADH-quinone oxidoreductase subunit C